jgi:FkbH-like protein
MDVNSHRCLLVSDFNAGPLAGYLRNDAESPVVEVVEAPYGAVESALLPEHAAWQQAPDCAVVWTRPQAVSAAFATLCQGEQVEVQRLEEDVQRFAALLAAASRRLRALLVPLWTVPALVRGLGVGDLKQGGVAWALLHMNAQLVRCAEEEPQLFALEAQHWGAAARGHAFDPKLWYMGKIAFANPVFRDAVHEIKAALRALDGRSKKLVVLDLDETLWGGIVGEVGWRGLRLGGHDHVGEAHADFQRALKALAQRGVLLALASRNEEDVALEAIDTHPEMVLRRDDFAAWRIHWGDKAESVAALVQELNIGLQDVVFIDDSAAERARVRSALPEVLVPEWPADPTRYVEALAALRCFDTVSLSREDSERTQLYAVERRRRQSQAKVSSLQQWLQSLELQVDAVRLSADHSGRAAQLLNKTNQMNLRTRRLGEAELLEWAAGPGREFWIFRVADRFGEAGLTGLLGLEKESETVCVSDFVLSCRVMGRQVEEAILHFATQRGWQMGGQSLVAQYAATEKNKPCLDLFARLFPEPNGHSFGWDLAQLFPLPPHVQLQI